MKKKYFVYQSFTFSIIMSLVVTTQLMCAPSGAWLAGALDLNWNNAFNWSELQVPNGISSIAAFIEAPGTTTVDSDANITIGSLHLDDVGNSLTIGFTATTLTFDNNTANSTIFIGSGQTHYINTPLILNGPLQIMGGTSGSLPIMQPISGTGPLIITCDRGGFNVQPMATNTYTDGTIVECGFFNVAATSPDVQVVPGDIIVYGSGVLTHDPAASNNYASTTQLTLNGGQMFMRGTTQTMQNIILSKSASITTDASATLRLNQLSPSVAILIGSGSAIVIDNIVLLNGGMITNDSSQPGQGLFFGAGSPTGFMTIDLNGNLNVPINADFNPLQGQQGLFELDFFNVQFVNGSINKVGSAAVLIEGALSKITDTTISNGTLTIGRSNADIIDGPAQVTVLGGATLSGFGNLGTGGNTVTVTNSAGFFLLGNLPFNIGDFTITGSYIQQANGLMAIFGASSIASSQLIVNSGSVQLAGGLFFEPTPGATFNAGDQFVIIDNTTGSGVTGTFDFFSYNLPACLQASVIYESNQVSILIKECTAPILVLPPTNLQGTQLYDRFVTQTDVINRLTWNASSTAGVVKYNIYRNGQLIGSVSASGPLAFDDHNRKCGELYLYGVTAVDGEGNESTAISITFPH